MTKKLRKDPKMTVHCVETVEMVLAKDLKPHPKNRNKHPESQIVQLAKILKYQGWRYPVKVSRLSGFVTSGHGRVLAAQSLGWTSIPVQYQDYSDADQEYADIQADNAIALQAELDLSGINLDLKEFDTAFDFDLLGLQSFHLEIPGAPAEEDANKAWRGMPEFTQEDKTGARSMAIHFHTEEDVAAFAKLIGQKITEKTRMIWYPEMIIEKAADKRYGSS